MTKSGNKFLGVLVASAMMIGCAGDSNSTGDGGSGGKSDGLGSGQENPLDAAELSSLGCYAFVDSSDSLDDREDHIGAFQHLRISKTYDSSWADSEKMAMSITTKGFLGYASIDEIGDICEFEDESIVCSSGDKGEVSLQLSLKSVTQRVCTVELPSEGSYLMGTVNTGNKTFDVACPVQQQTDLEQTCEEFGTSITLYTADTKRSPFDIGA